MPDRLVYWTVWSAARIFGLLYLRISIKGGHHLPSTGPVLVVANHASNLDPPLVATAFRHRSLRFLGKKELWESRILAWLLPRLGAMPVDRSSASDRGAIKASLECLRRGEALVVFPEGTRSPDGTLKEFHDGPSRIALMVPGTRIVPLRLRGTFEAWGRGSSFPRPAKVTITVGEPFDPAALPVPSEEKKALYRAVTNEMFARISNL